MSKTITKPLVIHTLRNTLNPCVVVSSIIAFLPLPDLRGGKKKHTVNKKEFFLNN